MSDKIEYNDFGFAALDADELKSVDSTINSSTASANAIIEKLDDFVQSTVREPSKGFR